MRANHADFAPHSVLLVAAQRVAAEGAVGVSGCGDEGERGAAW
jgi:hypothetical protein